MTEVMTQVFDANVLDVSEKGQYTWTLTAYQQRGNLWVKWNTNAPFRAQQGQLAVYSGSSFPSDPQADRKASCWDNENGGGSGWDTGLVWGSGWHVAWLAQASPNGPYKYAVQAVTAAA
jgi:hypothetical protein